jgi:MEDS: MEthanogen/methylotroph, DcmR Sensory domain
MVPQTADIAVRDCEHTVHLYARDCELIARLSTYVAGAARAGEAAIVIATEPHRRALQVELESQGIDLVELSRAGRYVWLDAASTLASFTGDGAIDHDALHEVIGGLLGRAGEAGRTVRVYGEMVALLWDDGHVPAAIELEKLWNALASEYRFSLLCSYPAASLTGSEHADALREVCQTHSSVCADIVLEDPSRQIELPAEFPRERDSPGRARRLVTAALERQGYEDALVRDVALVLSELATNAVVHAGSAFAVSIKPEEKGLRVSVGDSKPLVSAERRGGLDVRRGHGLDVIDLLSSSWDAKNDGEGGKVIWAELPYQAAPPSRPDGLLPTGQRLR